MEYKSSLIRWQMDSKLEPLVVWIDEELSHICGLGFTQQASESLCGTS